MSANLLTAKQVAAELERIATMLESAKAYADPHTPHITYEVLTGAIDRASRRIRAVAANL